MSNQRANEETGAHSDGGRVCQGLRETFPTLDTIDQNERGRLFPLAPNRVNTCAKDRWHAS